MGFNGGLDINIYSTAISLEIPTFVSVTIDGESYTCSKGQSSGNADCTVVKRNESDKAGTTCNTSSDYWSYCAFYYEFGTMIYSSYGSNAKDMADWCKVQLKSN